MRRWWRAFITVLPFVQAGRADGAVHEHRRRRGSGRVLGLQQLLHYPAETLTLEASAAYAAISSPSPTGAACSSTGVVSRHREHKCLWPNSTNFSVVCAFPSPPPPHLPLIHCGHAEGRVLMRSLIRPVQYAPSSDAVPSGKVLSTLSRNVPATFVQNWEEE